MLRANGLAVMAAIALSGCASTTPQPVNLNDPMTVLVLDAASVSAFTREARARRGAPVQYLSANFGFVADADPAWCAFQLEWYPPGQRVDLTSPERWRAYEAARAAAGVSRPDSLSFRIGAGEVLSPFANTALQNWTLVLPRFRRPIEVRPAESLAFVAASFDGYARIALTSAERRNVSFKPGTPMSFKPIQAPVTLVGPFRVVVERDAVNLVYAPGDEESIRATAASVTGRPLDEVRFAPLAAETADRCPE